MTRVDPGRSRGAGGASHSGGTAELAGPSWRQNQMWEAHERAEQKKQEELNQRKAAVSAAAAATSLACAAAAAAARLPAQPGACARTGPALRPHASGHLRAFKGQCITECSTAGSSRHLRQGIHPAHAEGGQAPTCVAAAPAVGPPHCGAGCPPSPRSISSRRRSSSTPWPSSAQPISRARMRRRASHSVFWLPRRLRGTVGEGAARV